MIERSAAGAPVDAGQELELRRMEWFISLGFKALFAVASDSEIAAAEKRFGSHLDELILSTSRGSYTEDERGDGAGKPWPARIVITNGRAFGWDDFEAANLSKVTSGTAL
ncbi:hypothetical protein [Bradyrhizobium yuanmingense]|uniref:hypothetical protein n=1 Tax=Bradyrhizobium yuanmingense TaxID=108015 RepID=UPI001F0AC0F3|nr:hypothetical protein [Bradyrhizobium yuanmingense]